MKQHSFTKTVLLTAVCVLFLFSGLWAEGEKIEVNKTFDATKIVSVKIISGDCIVKAGGKDKIDVHLVYTYPKDKFKPVLEIDGDTLVLKEDFEKGENCNIKGHSNWTITVPAKTDIFFKAASGNLDLAGLKGELNLKTASGNLDINDVDGQVKAKAASGEVRMKNCNGQIAVKVASGNIAIKEVKGTLELKCASGNIKATEIILTGASQFKTASGNIKVELAKTAEYDIAMGTASGNIKLDYNGNKIKGHFLFKGQKGNISSSVPFDNKDSENKYSPFVKKYFTKGGDTPKITLKTVSGQLELK